MSKQIALFFCLIILVVVCAACSTPTPTPTPLPTATPIPTDTPTPTATSTFTPTSTPTLTPKPTDTPTPTPTDTPVPPTATPTSIPPSSTPIATRVPPTATNVPNPCNLQPGQAGLLLNNTHDFKVLLTIGGGEWGTHDYWFEPNSISAIQFPPGRYTATLNISGRNYKFAADAIVFEAGSCTRMTTP